MRILRQLSSRRLVALIGAAVAAGLVASVISIAALGSSAPTPAPKPLDRALADALRVDTPAGVTGRIRFTNALFPSGALNGVSGNEGSALTSGASGRFWWSPDAGGRIELQSNAGDAQILWDKTRLTVYDSSSNTVYRLPLPAHRRESRSAPPTLADVDRFLKDLAGEVSVSDPAPSNVAGQPAYRVTVEPQHSAGLLGSLGLAWDAVRGVPLEVAVRAQGQSAPVLALKVTEISFGPVSASDVTVTPRAGARVVDLGTRESRGENGGGNDQPPVTGLEAVQAQVPFTIVAPETLVGLPRQSVRLIGATDKGALVLYGHGLGGIALVERTARGEEPGKSLPAVAVGSVSGHELATQLGTILLFTHRDVSFVLAGSMPTAGAEAAARSLIG